MILVPFNSDFADYMHRWYHDPELRHYFRGYVGGLSMAQAAQMPAFLRAHILVGIAEDGEPAPAGTPVGMITFADVDPVLRVYRVGLLVDSAHQNGGFALKLGQKGMEWVFNTMNAHRLYAECVSTDERLLKGLRAFGMKDEGVERQSCFLDGKYHDEVILAMLQSDWREVKPNA